MSSVFQRCPMVRREQKQKKNGHIRNRTGDLFLAREARYQLRHVPCAAILCDVVTKCYDLYFGSCDHIGVQCYSGVFVSCDHVCGSAR